MQDTYMTYIEGLFIAFDQFINAVLGGWPDETLSSRCWWEEQQGFRAWPRKLVDGLFFWQRRKENASSSRPDCAARDPRSATDVEYSGRGGGVRAPPPAR